MAARKTAEQLNETVEKAESSEETTEEKKEMSPVERREISRQIFEELNGVNVNGFIEKKPTGKRNPDGTPQELSYLSWADCISEVMKHYPDIEYEIIKNENNLPYFVDPLLGIMVYTRVTINGITRECWLPVMDSANNALKLEPYTIHTKFGDKEIPAADMNSINRALMRCITKNISLFGLGLYIYKGADLPDDEAADIKAQEENTKVIQTIIRNIDTRIKELTVNMDKAAKQKFADEVILPVVGMQNYRNCRDKDKLNALYEKIKAA